MIRLFVTVFATSLLASSALAQSSFNWSFGYIAGQPTAVPTFKFGTGATVSPVQAGNTLAASTFGTVNPSWGYAGASGTNWFGAAVSTAALNTATSSYFTVTLTPQAGKVLELKEFGFSARTPITGGPTLYAIRTSADGFTTTIAAGAITPGLWMYQTQFGSLAKLGTKPGVPVELRLYVYGGGGVVNAATPNVTIDDLQISYQAVDAPAPPPDQKPINGNPRPGTRLPIGPLPDNKQNPSVPTRQHR